MELADKGSLLQYLSEKPQNRLSEQEAFPIFFQLCLAVDYLHRRGTVHGNLTVNTKKSFTFKKNS